MMQLLNWFVVVVKQSNTQGGLMYCVLITIKCIYCFTLYIILLSLQKLKITKF